MRSVLSRPDVPLLPGAPRPGPLGRLAGLAHRRRGRVLAAWAAALAAAFGLSTAFGGEFATDSTTPGSDSARAQQLLGERLPAQSGDAVQVVVRAADVTAAEVRRDVGALARRAGPVAARGRGRGPLRDRRCRRAGRWSRA